MSYDRHTADRLRSAVMRAGPEEPIDERFMFGGVTLLLGGCMACGVLGEDLVVRVGKAGLAEALRQPHARPMDFTGKPLASFVYVAPAGFASDAALDRWVAAGLAGARAASEKKSRRVSPRAVRRAPFAGARR